MKDLRLADSKGDYTTIWKIIHDLSGKEKKSSVKVNKRDGTPPTSDKDLLAEWRKYFSSLLNNSSGEPLSEPPPPAIQDNTYRYQSTYTQGDSFSTSPNLPNEEEQGCGTRQCNHSQGTSEWWWCNGGNSPRLLYRSVQYPYPTQPMDHQHHCSRRKILVWWQTTEEYLFCQ